jgi:mono/diheme cytochrome c family protein
MTRRIIPWAIFVAIAATVPQSGVAAQATTTDSAAIAQGRKLFESKGLCFTCHGKAGEGLLGPTTRLAGRAFTHTKGSIGELAELVRTGVPAEKSTSGQVMPPRGGSRLTDREVDLVATYVKALNGGKLK